MITVEEAINVQHQSSGFILQHRRLLGENDRVMFPNGVSDVIQFAAVFAQAPVYTWASPVKRMVDQSCADYPLHEAIGAIHYFHRPAMLWVFDEAVMMIEPPRGPRLNPGAVAASQSVDGILMVPYRHGDSRPLSEFMHELMQGLYATPEERAQLSKAVCERATGLQITALSSIRTGITVPLPVGSLLAGSRVMVPVMHSCFVFGHNAVVYDDTIVDCLLDDPTIRQEQTQIRQWVLAATALLKQRILVAESQLATRGERKRLDRQGLPTSVMTITLRETEQQSTSTHQGVIDWSHRWIVRGHWRQQWYASQEEHRIVWIPAYIKGPADRPLVVRPAVYAVTR